MEFNKKIQLERRSANYKPNIWRFDFLTSVSNKFHEEDYEKLKMEVESMFGRTDRLALLELINNVNKLGLSSLFKSEIDEALQAIVSNTNVDNFIFKDLYSTALSFRLLRQHGYHQVHQGMFNEFMDERGDFIECVKGDVKGMIEVYEASQLALEDEDLLNNIKLLAIENLKKFGSTSDSKFNERVRHAVSLPNHWRVQWFNVRWNINMFEKERHRHTFLVKLAKLNFNMVQAVHQNDLQEMTRWWKNLGLIENLSFARDRLVESFMCSLGLAYEQEFRFFRKWLTKVVVLILIIDDLYDVYGSLQELQLFTDAIDRWDDSEIQHLPEAMKICFSSLYKITAEIAKEIQMELGLDQHIILPYLLKVWAEFCKALLVEAKWYNNGDTPTLHEYLSNAWISSSGPVILLHAFFATMPDINEKKVAEFLHQNQEELVYNSSLIIRLCNDLGTSEVEMERGDAPSSIVCYMREANVSEEIARKHIKGLIIKAWKSVNLQSIAKFQSERQLVVKIGVNAARIAHYLYQNGDGFGVQDCEIRDDVISLLIRPLN